MFLKRCVLVSVGKMALGGSATNIVTPYSFLWCLSGWPDPKAHFVDIGLCVYDKRNHVYLSCIVTSNHHQL